MFFTTVAPGASHVGIVIGGDQFVHAPSERGVVRVESLSAAVLGDPLHWCQARQLNEPGPADLSAEASDANVAAR